jgi:concanavalin A-like lectin/glucanase superfamily protein
VPISLEKLIARCLRKNPEERFQDMGAVKTALERVLETPGVRLLKIPSGRARRLMLGFGSLFLVIGVAAGIWWPKRPRIGPYTAPERVPCFGAPSGMLGWWPGDGSAADIVGHNQGTPHNGVQFVRGMVGRAFRFNGEAAHVRAGDSTVLAPPSVTVEFWMNASAAPLQDHNHPVARWGHLYSGEANSWVIDFRPEQRLYFCVQTDISRIANCAGAKTQIVVGEWHHVAGTFDSADSTIRIYLDGRLEDERKHYGAMQALPSMTAIGCKYAEGECKYPFTGYVDELAIYNGALTGDTIRRIYAAGALGKCKGF